MTAIAACRKCGTEPLENARFCHGCGGISSDFSFDYADFVAELTRNPQLFDDSYTRWGPIRWMPPETLLTLGEHLAGRGWNDADIHPVLGGNFFRVAQQAWRA